MNVLDSIIETLLRASVRLHNVLHGFCAGRVMETAIMDLKLAQELASADQDPLFLVFLDLRKAYDTVDCGLLLTTLEGYGSGSHICSPLAVFGTNRSFAPTKTGTTART